MSGKAALRRFRVFRIYRCFSLLLQEDIRRACDTENTDREGALSFCNSHPFLMNKPTFRTIVLRPRLVKPDTTSQPLRKHTVSFYLIVFPQPRMSWTMSLCREPSTVASFTLAMVSPVWTRTHAHAHKRMCMRRRSSAQEAA